MIGPTEDPVVNTVIAKLVARSEEGMKHYGISMADETKPLVWWLEQALEETLDKANYLQKAIMILKAQQPE